MDLLPSKRFSLAKAACFFRHALPFLPLQLFFQPQATLGSYLTGF